MTHRVKTALGVSFGVAAAVLYVLRARHHLTDLAVYLTAGRRFLAGEALYRASDLHYQFKYAPSFAALVAPVAALPDALARPLWYAATAAAVALALHLARHVVAGAPPRAWLVAAALTLPLFARELELGQVNVFMLVLALAATLALRAGHETRAGALLGLAVHVKLPALVLLVPLALRPRPPARVFAATFATLAALAVLPALRYGPDGFAAQLADWATSLAASTPGLAHNADNQSWWAVTTRWFAAPSAAAAVFAVLVAAAFAALSFAARRRDDAVQVSLALVLMSLLSPLGWHYTHLTALPALAVAAARLRRDRASIALAAVIVATFGLVHYELLRRTLYYAAMGAGVRSLGATALCALVLVTPVPARPAGPR
jgi:hypothetical protein